MSGKDYQAGSEVALGLQLCKDMDDKWFQEGWDVAAGKRFLLLWNDVQWAGFHAGLAFASAGLLMGEPHHATWRAAGSPSCGATWEDAPPVEAEQDREEYIGL